MTEASVMEVDVGMREVMMISFKLSCEFCGWKIELELGTKRCLFLYTTQCVEVAGGYWTWSLGVWLTRSVATVNFFEFELNSCAILIAIKKRIW